MDLFPTATISASVDTSAVAALPPGSSLKQDLAGQVQLKDQIIAFAVPVLITRAGADAVTVAALRPLILTAAHLGLSEGVEQLRQIAGLPNISQAVPITFVLTFRRAEADTI